MLESPVHTAPDRRSGKEHHFPAMPLLRMVSAQVRDSVASAEVSVEDGSVSVVVLPSSVVVGSSSGAGSEVVSSVGAGSSVDGVSSVGAGSAAGSSAGVVSS